MEGGRGAGTLNEVSRGRGNVRCNEMDVSKVGGRMRGCVPGRVG